MKIKIEKGKPCGTVTAPPSKSYAHRMMICAALSEGESVITGVCENEDVLATLDCISTLGASAVLKGDTLIVSGVGGKIKDGIKADKNLCFSCRESGSTLRFMIPVSLILGKNTEFNGSERLMQRGIGVYETLFAEKGISCRSDSGKISLSGELKSGEYVLPGNVSSQFVTGLILALPLLDGDSTVRVLEPVESRGYIDITVDVMRSFGIEITEKEENVFFVRGSQSYKARKVKVEGDWSNGAALLALGEVTSNGLAEESGENSVSEVRFGEVTVEGLSSESLQGDRICVELLKRLRTRDGAIDISGCPDLGPVLFSVAAAQGGGEFIGTQRLKIKESDRAQAMAAELEKFGAMVTVFENSVTVGGGTLRTPSLPCDSHNDHRIVMALSVLGALVGCEIEGAEAIAKSYPDFFDTLALLGLNIKTDSVG